MKDNKAERGEEAANDVTNVTDATDMTVRNDVPTRAEIDDRYKWKLEDIFTTDQAWQTQYASESKRLAAIHAYKGRLHENEGKQLLRSLKEYYEGSLRLEELYVYARCRRDEDNADCKYQDMCAHAEHMATRFNEMWSFLEPEILAIDGIEEMYAKTPELEEYRFVIDNIIRQRAHVLTDVEERLLAGAAETMRTGDDAYTMLSNADMKYPQVYDDEGKKVELTDSRYAIFIRSEQRSVRKRAFKALLDTYDSYRNTIAACLSGNVRTDVFIAKTRKYGSALEAELDGDNVPVQVYESLIEAVNSRLDALNRYLTLRRKMLGVRYLHMFDLYVPIVSVPKRTYTFEEGCEIVLKALAPLGEAYVSDVRAGIESGWVDVYENKGKTSGAYSWGCYTGHPYVLLNWQGTNDDLYTLAHELGHSMHSLYSNRTQPPQYAGYSIFVAEVASTVNENLLVRYMLDQCSDKDERLYHINHYLEEFRTTVYRQTMFAEFEKSIHEAVEHDVPLTSEYMNNIYYNLNRRYYGKEVNVDEIIGVEWSRIPHFYNAYYVYQYATGFSAAALLAEQLTSSDKASSEAALKRYLRFLSSGGSAYPIDILKSAGVDLSTPEPVEQALDIFERYVALSEEEFGG